MQENNAQENVTSEASTPQTSQTPPLEGISLEQNPSPAPKPGKKNTRLIVLIVVAVALVGVVAFLVLSGKVQLFGGTSYSTARNPETGERPLFGTDETKDNSGEAFVKFEKSIINDSNATSDEKFDAYLHLASYYTSTENYTEAEKALESIDQSTLTEDQQLLYDEALLALNDAKNGVEQGADILPEAPEGEETDTGAEAQDSAEESQPETQE